MYVLSGKKPLSSGDFRSCYEHPTDPSKCIKVAQKRSRMHHVGKIERLTGQAALNPNDREVAEYDRQRAKGTPLETYFPKLYGPVETDLGDGLCFERMQGDDGSKPMSLSDLLQDGLPEGLRADFVLKEVRKFQAFCEQYGILASCDEPGNIAFVRQGNGYRLISYDLKYRLNKEIIPFSSIFMNLRRKKIARRFDRLLEPISGALAQMQHS